MNQINLFNQETNDEKVIENQSRWSKLVKDKYGWRCANEEKYPDRDHTLFELNSHHIWPKKLGGKNTLKNGIVYCRACHAAEHPEYQQKFISNIRLAFINVKDFLKKFIGIPGELKYYRLLKFLTGNLNFRPMQKDILKAIVEEKKHVFVVMPTGHGKSLLYQIPALLKDDNPTLILSPLKALQVDQVKNLLKRWLPATYINSSLDKDELDERIKNIFNKTFKFIFTHPKQLLFFDKEKNNALIKYQKPLASMNFNYLVIDEAHVIKNYGPFFVKEYYHINKIRQLYKNAQMILLTATASKKTREFIIKKLGFEKDEIKEFVSGFMRKEIKLEVYFIDKYIYQDRYFKSKNDALIKLLENKPEGKTIIFCTSTNQVDFVYKFLINKGFRVCRFHSKLGESEKKLSERLFKENRLDEKIDIMIATSAFGMGIDIPNIHQIIHYSLPFSLTDYYQQIGRAGRDGQLSYAQLIYDKDESTNLIDFINSENIKNEKDKETIDILTNIFKEEKEALLNYVYAPNKWEYILKYFGEDKKEINIYQILNFIYIIIVIILFFLFYKFNVF